MITQEGLKPSLAAIRPLVVCTQPQAGEHLSSVLVRACEANVFTKTLHLLDLIGLPAQASEAVPFTHASDAPAMAKLLGTTADEIECRMHPPVQDDLGRGMVNWYGGSIERRHLEAAVRRYAPRSLEQCGYYHATWSVRLLDYCPVTMEHLLSTCPQCSRPLGWRACRFILKCDKCGASLLTAESRTVPVQFHDAAQIGAALISPFPHARQTALASLSDPFDNWAPADALEGFLTLGAAQLWLEAPEDSSESVGSAACIAAGMEFARHWPDSLSKYVKAATERTKSTSARAGLGPLGRLFSKSARKTPIRELVRSRISNSLGEAVVPAKVYAGGIIKRACRDGKLTALEAVNKLGISLRHLRRLEGRSQTFLARHAVKGGAVLYDEAAISRLATALSTSRRHRDAVRLLGIPSHCIEALTSSGLVMSVSDPDANIVSETPLVTEASIFALRDGLRRRSRDIEGGLTLRKTLQRDGDPHDWVAVLQKLLAGRIPLQFDDTENLALTDAVFVRADDVARHVMRRSDGLGISDVDICCQAAAEIIGATPQFVSAAVKAGFIEGKIGKQNSALPLEGVLTVQKNFIFAGELREKIGGHQKTIACDLRKAGIKPAVTINRTIIWRRTEIERFIAEREASGGPSDSEQL